MPAYALPSRWIAGAAKTCPSRQTVASAPVASDGAAGPPTVDAVAWSRLRRVYVQSAKLGQTAGAEWAVAFLVLAAWSTTAGGRWVLVGTVYGACLVAASPSVGRRVAAARFGRSRRSALRALVAKATGTDLDQTAAVRLLALGSTQVGRHLLVIRPHTSEAITIDVVDLLDVPESSLQAMYVDAFWWGLGPSHH